MWGCSCYLGHQVFRSAESLKNQKTNSSPISTASWRGCLLKSSQQVPNQAFLSQHHRTGWCFGSTGSGRSGSWFRFGLKTALQNLSFVWRFEIKHCRGNSVRSCDSLSSFWLCAHNSSRRSDRLLPVAKSVSVARPSIKTSESQKRWTAARDGRTSPF